MTARKVTDGPLAGLPGVHRSAVTQYRGGHRRWSPKFQAKLAAWLAAGGDKCSPDDPRVLPSGPGA